MAPSKLDRSLHCRMPGLADALAAPAIELAASGMRSLEARAAIRTAD